MENMQPTYPWPWAVGCRLNVDLCVFLSGPQPSTSAMFIRKNRKDILLDGSSDEGHHHNMINIPSIYKQTKSIVVKFCSNRTQIVPPVFYGISSEKRGKVWDV